MKILIANYEMKNFFGGTQTWTITMVTALRKLGHDVQFTGMISTINFLFHPLYQNIQDRYDLLIANGNATLHYFKHLADTKILVSHGVLPQLEQPTRGADIILAVSEEVSLNIQSKGFVCNGIIRNPIDMELYNNTNISDEIKVIGFLDRRRQFPYIDEISERYKVLQIGNPPTFDVKSQLEKCDLIVARGRGIYEAMALSKNVIVSGNNSGRSSLEMMDGFVSNESFLEFRKNNCSGRRMGITVCRADMFLNEIDKATPQQAINNQKLMFKYNDSTIIAKQILNYLQ